MAYFFKILDVNSDGYLDNYELRYFYTELRLAYNGWFMDGAMPEFGDFTDQFYDMVKPAVNRRFIRFFVKFCLKLLIVLKNISSRIACMQTRT